MAAVARTRLFGRQQGCVAHIEKLFCQQAIDQVLQHDLRGLRLEKIFVLHVFILRFESLN